MFMEKSIIIKTAHVSNNNMDELIYKHALHNAVKHDGKASQGAVIGNVIGEKPELKENVKDLAKKVGEIVKKVNAMSIDQQNKELMKYPEVEKKEKEKSDELKDLDDVDIKKGVIMRFAPSPSGPMHIGHAITGGITSLYVKKYGGKFILRIEDTNSDNIDLTAYKLLPKDGDWIFGNVSDVIIQSDRMEIYYDYVNRLLKLDAIYVCTCSQDEFKRYSDSMQDCPCRKLSVEENSEKWKKMLDKKGFKEGEAVVRFKSSMQDKNPAMRDFPLLRINETAHPRQKKKYRVWPLMNFSVTVDDIESGMTHIIRAKEHADNAKRQEMIFKVLGKKFPHTYFLGRYNFEGFELSTSKTRKKIEAGEYSGWDDIRLPFLLALKRRGYQPSAFLKFTQSTGLSPVDKTVSGEEFFKSINALNKEIIDPVAKRFFFIADPVKVEIKNAPTLNVELDFHPDNIKGGRKFLTGKDFFLSNVDISNFSDNELIRLMDCLNFRVNNAKYVFVSEDYETFKKNGKKIIHWLPVDKSLVSIEVLMPDNKKIKGLCEKGIGSIKEGDIVQFERFGFCRLDDKKKMVFWFTHK